MKGIRFYLEYPSARAKRSSGKGASGEHDGNVVAVFNGTLSWIRRNGFYDAIGAIFEYPNSPVCSTTAHVGYLREQCKRIPEHVAREIHPNLFAYLDSTED